MIPVLDLTRQTAALQEELHQAVQRVFSTGHFILGEEVDAFERAFASYCGVRYAVGVASGTDALELALRALDIGPGDEVITTPFSFIAAAEAISYVGAVPVFADIEASSYNLDPARVEAMITERTRAVIVVHLYGDAANLEAFQSLASRYRVALIEDCAQAVGTRYRGRHVGTFGVMGCFSFFPSKNLGAFGDGGLVTTQDAALAASLSRLRAHGSEQKYRHDVLGRNSRLDALQAAVLGVKLPHVERWVDARRRIAGRYADGLRDLHERGALRLPVEPRDSHSSYHVYTVAVSADCLPTAGADRKHPGGGQSTASRDQLQARLREQGIATAVHYPIPIYAQPVYASGTMLCRSGDCPRADEACRRVLSLPCFPEMTDSEIDAVIKSVRQVCS